MTITLDLNEEELAALNARAQSQGTDIQTVVHQLIGELKPPVEQPTPEEKRQALIALFDKWREEDATEDPEELARREADLEEFKANINRWRAEEGRPPAYQ